MGLTAVAVSVLHGCGSERCVEVPSMPPLGEAEELYMYSVGWWPGRASDSVLWTAPVALGEAVIVVERRELGCDGDSGLARKVRVGPVETVTVEVEPPTLARLSRAERTDDGRLLLNLETLEEGDGMLVVSADLGGARRQDRRRLSVRAFADMALGDPGSEGSNHGPVVEGGSWPVEPWPASAGGEVLALPSAPELPWTRPDGSLELVPFGPTGGVEHAARWPRSGVVKARIGRIERGVAVAAESIDVVPLSHVVSGEVQELTVPRKLMPGAETLSCVRGEVVLTLAVKLIDSEARTLSGAASLLESSDTRILRLTTDLSGAVRVQCAVPGTAVLSLVGVETVPFRLEVRVR